MIFLMHDCFLYQCMIFQCMINFCISAWSFHCIVSMHDCLLCQCMIFSLFQCAVIVMVHDPFTANRKQALPLSRHLYVSLVCGKTSTQLHLPPKQGFPPPSFNRKRACTILVPPTADSPPPPSVAAAHYTGNICEYF